IGEGSCGTVWSADDTHYAIKREEGGSEGSLYNGFVMHQKALKAALVTTPDSPNYVPVDDPWWNDHLERFPNGHRPCNALISERIPHFPREVRDRIIDRYSPESIRASSKEAVANRDCLIRPYLGCRRQHKPDSESQAFSLRNYPLHADQMEELGLDTTLYAKKLAEGLAELYWKVRLDADDVEFVLAPPRKTDDEFQTVLKSETLGDHSIWILDFDRCKSITLDGYGVTQAVIAFVNNDPYFPQPGSDNEKDEALWKTFKDHFLEASQA
ncbi:hypothetical protein P152DRAFT_369925, partial [Eremomyces bilateralis CBS 781.70]